MRNFCNYLTFLAVSFFSGEPEVEEMESPTFRLCANVKSKRHIDVQCKCRAVNGDFCARHWKRPHRYVPLATSESSRQEDSLKGTITRSFTLSIKKIQSWWRHRLPMRSYSQKGPIAHVSMSMAQNQTEVYSMEQVKDIPKMYLYSCVDSTHSLWIFDIRTLSHMLSQGRHPTNPYTRDIFSSVALQRLRSRLAWLRKRKYPVLYLHDDNLTPEQEWNQHVLDIFLKLEALGYLMGCSWFHELRIEDHKDFYRALFQLWNWRLGLSPEEKERIIPNYTKQAVRLFRWTPDVIHTIRHDLKWWQKVSLTLINNFVTRSEDKSKQSLGALYILMGLVQVSEEAADAYPWIVESLS